ncbi:UDP-N-acetylmuramoylalanyl-D-glutamyl-2, 6-diaminopimelate--D-alanyl-D-alanine ligase [Sphingomonas sp. Leaf231]|uniref:UDP-N-acetylmuramoyl-tripeptide--D-alanyl-D- alanine ligase n=1 Tax=Sphingomonas sp. Leaf231 TaxID=1736301 RepID=UPI0006F60480|nr:UDP-N-acetylmuramoyl-tripeptide--D-alanyl-D-alanine ligase [Sphingomonas sp. Leaf231]KQN92940.1 UDP-N-acetylmuramoylalanyl-D-glutamyl-2, 6-diaminopimelate--D-alanyl-D-alanine ligase [Sphingomonas sp. Leaf231]
MTLWTAAEIAAATGGTMSGDFAVNGVAFDSREVGHGDLFVALTGEQTDGHRFVEQAFAQGAGGAIVSQPVSRPSVRVGDTFAALEDLARAARARVAGKVIGVTGSVGKTSTKEALFAALDRAPGIRAHRSVKSYNNHTGVPLSLARMPAATDFAVLEMGMNHPGELAHLTTLVRPHVALVTAIAPAHTEFFPDERAIADAKAEIFRGLEPGGTAIVPFDSPHRDRLIEAAKPYAGRIVTFGMDRAADVGAGDAMTLRGGGSFVNATVGGRELNFTIAQPGRHWISNALAVLAVADAVGADVALAGLALAELGGLPGRGARITVAVGGKGDASGEAVLIDESYNANPASMRATLAVLAQTPGRHVAVLGEMRELGDGSADFHAGLAADVIAARVEAAVLVGQAMAPLAEALEGRIDFVHVPDAAQALDRLRALIRPGDAVLVKGSNGVGLSRLVSALANGIG